MSMKSEKSNLCGRDYYPPTLVVSTSLQNQDLQHRTAVMIGLTEPKSSMQTRIMNYS